MLEIFRTNVSDADVAGRLTSILHHHFPQSRINFDLHDCDHILRVEGTDFCPDKIAGLVQEHGFDCILLED